MSPDENTYLLANLTYRWPRDTHQPILCKGESLFRQKFHVQQVCGHPDPLGTSLSIRATLVGTRKVVLPFLWQGGCPVSRFPSVHPLPSFVAPPATRYSENYIDHGSRASSQVFSQVWSVCGTFCAAARVAVLPPQSLVLQKTAIGTRERMYTARKATPLNCHYTRPRKLDTQLVPGESRRKLPCS